MERLFGDLQTLLQGRPWLALPAVFVGGLMTALNPCVLAMVPLMIGMVAGSEAVSGAKKSFLFSLFFVLGLSATFTALGLVSALLGRMFGDVGRFWKYLVVAVCLLMGTHLLGLWRAEFRLPAVLKAQKTGIGGAFLAGLLFGVVSTPCAVPVLAVLLAFVAQKGNPLFGALLLFIYALGHAALVLVAGTSVGAAKTLLESRGLRKATAVLQKAAGVLIIGAGIYMFLR
jgi:cytochrome c-type biogenesis protein